MRTSRFTRFALVLSLVAAPFVVHADGRVDRIRIDSHGRASGVILRDGTEYVVPPARAERLARMVVPGDVLRVERGSEDMISFVDARNGRWMTYRERENAPVARGGGPSAPATFLDQYPMIDDAATLGKHTVRGRVAMITYSPQHLPTGFLLSDGTQVHLVPSAASVLTEFHPGDQVTVEGRGTDTPRGLGMWAIVVEHGDGTVALDMLRGIGAPELGMPRVAPSNE